MARRDITEEIVRAVEVLPSGPSRGTPPELGVGPTVGPTMLPPPERSQDRLVRIGSDAPRLSWRAIEVRLEEDLGEPWSDIPESERDNGVAGEWDNAPRTPHDCAWYVSYHWKDPHWGIHILESCWWEIARKFWRHQPPNHFRAPSDAVRAAFFYLFDHELFHYCADVGASILEITRGKADVYVPHFSTVYLVTFGTKDCVEESLANRFAYGRYKTMRVNKDYLSLILKRQLDGYRQFDQYKGGRFWEGLRLQMNEFYYCTPRPRHQIPIETTLELVPQDAYAAGHRVPIYLRVPPAAPQRIYPRF